MYLVFVSHHADSMIPATFAINIGVGSFVKVEVLLLCMQSVCEIQVKFMNSIQIGHPNSTLSICTVGCNRSRNIISWTCYIIVHTHTQYPGAGEERACIDMRLSTLGSLLPPQIPAGYEGIICSKVRIQN